jgi:hypothetical protein
MHTNPGVSVGVVVAVEVGVVEVGVVVIVVVAVVDVGVVVIVVVGVDGPVYEDVLDVKVVTVTELTVVYDVSVIVVLSAGAPVLSVGISVLASVVITIPVLVCSCVLSMMVLCI